MRTLIVSLVLLIVSVSSAVAAEELTISAPGQQTLPLALTDFIPTPGQTPNPALMNEFQQILKYDLELSGLFELVNPDSFLGDAKRIGLRSVDVNFSEWRLLGADLVLKGTYRMDGDRLVIVPRLYDVPRQKLLYGVPVVGDRASIRNFAHELADKILEALTDETGPFKAKIAFINNSTGNKELYLMDTDGHGVVRLTAHGGIVLNPDFTPPPQREISFTSYKRGNPDLYRRELRSGVESVISRRSGLNIGGRFSPDGRRVALTQSQSGNTDIVIIGANGRGRTQITRHWGIDVDPSWSPDGKELAFVSDRRGNPHIFIVDDGGEKVRRLTFEGKYNATPAWSPKGDRIAFTRLENRRFDVYTIRPDGTDERRLTFGAGSKEHPRWSPDGRFLVYSNDVSGKKAIWIMRADGTGGRPIHTGQGVSQHPTWSTRW